MLRCFVAAAAAQRQVLQDVPRVSTGCHEDGHNEQRSLRLRPPSLRHPSSLAHTVSSRCLFPSQLKHALAGVEKGRKAGTAPVEIMGLMIGKASGESIVVLDACPLPVEGSETRVVADDAQVHMLQLMDSMELRRKEGFVGWYHSHPFDVESYSHCHMSAIDVQTQTSWQNASPTWTAIVIDPLRSLAKQEPELGCFRVYPPKHSPPANQCPDGTINADATSRTVRWGLTYHRYYQLPIDYFLSELGSELLDTMSRRSLWVRVLSSSSLLEVDNRARVSERVKKVNDKLQAAETALAHYGGMAGRGGGMYGHVAHTTAGPAGSSGSGSGKARVRGVGGDEMQQASVAGSEIAIEQCKGHSTQVVKELLFDFVQRVGERERRKELEEPKDGGTGKKEEKKQMEVE